MIERVSLSSMKVSAGDLGGEEAETRCRTEFCRIFTMRTVVIEVTHNEYVLVFASQAADDVAHEVPLSFPETGTRAGLHVNDNSEEIEARSFHPESAHECRTLLSQALDTFLRKTRRVDPREYVPEGESTHEIHHGRIVEEPCFLRASVIREDESPGRTHVLDRESGEPLRLENLIYCKDRRTESPNFTRQRPPIGPPGVSSFALRKSTLFDTSAIVVARKHADVERSDSQDIRRACLKLSSRPPR